jgi:iron(III) transport system permease protein
LPLAATLLCLPTLIPLGAAAWSWTDIEAGLLQHLLRFVLPDATANTLALMVGVLGGVLLLGVSTSALVALTEFPGRRAFALLLLLPLALPGYVLAIAFLGIFEGAGSEWAEALRLVGFRGLGGLVFVLSAALYPYVFLIAREAFATTGLRAIEAARSLGLSPMRAFWWVALPLALPWIGAGASLALMEVLADFGTVAAFNYDTLSVAIYKAWYGLFSTSAALQIASVMLVFIVSLLSLESLARRRMRFESVGVDTIRRLPLRGAARWSATGWCTLVFLACFALPVGWLAWRASGRLDLVDTRFLSWIRNSATLALAAAGIIIAIAALLASLAHAAPSPLVRLTQRIATLGYAFPGALLAVGLYVPLSHFGGLLGGGFAGALAGGGVALLLCGYGVRFLAVGHAPVASSTMRIPRSSLDSARLAGIPRRGILRLVYWPALRSSMAVGALLVFVDVMKEMPITLMMRPFGWGTLATRIFEFTSEGQWQEAAVPAMVLVAVGVLPIWLLQRQTGRG